jgi:hypothetical protein
MRIWRLENESTEERKNGGPFISGNGTKLPFAAVKTTSAFWGTAVEKCSL